jgi:biopolymer transport protein ExbD
MKKISRCGHSTLNELNITPGLDLVFVLLVIFIVTAPQMANSLEIALPSGQPLPASQDAPTPKTNHIVANDKGQTFLNDDALPDAELKEKLRGIKGADNVGDQRVMKSLDALQPLEITKTGRVTQART